MLDRSLSANLTTKLSPRDYKGRAISWDQLRAFATLVVCIENKPSFIECA